MSEVKYRDDITSCHLFVMTNSISSYAEKYFILNVFLAVNLAQCVGLLQCCVVLLQ